jgi:hypothetical protein
MKRIVRLTESDLTRIVKRIISESAVATDAMIQQAKSTGGNMEDIIIAQGIYNAKGYIYDDPRMAGDALYKIKDKTQYYRVQAIVNRWSGYSSIIDYLNSFMKGKEMSGCYNTIKDLLGATEANKLNHEYTTTDKMFSAN